MQRIIRSNRITEFVGLSRRQCDRLEAEGNFPRKVKLGENSTGWLESDVQDWIEARAAERDQSQPRAGAR
jgi:prophage regulatory protein